ncbi:MAG: hypothetical protein ABJB02_07060 [Dokdonella sp.]
MHKSLFAGILAALVASTAFPALAASTSSTTDFERVFPSSYRDMLRDAKRAYGAKQYDEAFKLFQRSACAGDKESQSAVGRMYLLGQGVQRADLVGYAWLKVAAEVIFPGYQSIIAKLDSAMTPAQHETADRLAKTTIDRYGMVATHMSCQKNASRGGHIVDSIVCTPENQGSQLLLKRCVVDAPH